MLIKQNNSTLPDLESIIKELNSRRYWEVEYTDGKVISEKEMHWKDIPKVGIERLTLYYDGREWNIEGKNNYIQKKRASMVPGVPESFMVESRSIGYYEDNFKIWYTVNELTGKMTMEVVDING